VHKLNNFRSLVVSVFSQETTIIVVRAVIAEANLEYPLVGKHAYAPYYWLSHLIISPTVCRAEFLY